MSAVCKPVRYFLTLCLPLLLFSSTCWAHPEDPAVVFVSTEAPPYWSPELPNQGFAGALLQLISKEAGVNYSLEYLPAKRFRQSQAKYIVGDPDLLITQGHRAVFPIGIFRSAFFSYQPHHHPQEITSLRDLQGHSLGVLRGTIDDPSLFNRYQVRVEESDTVESLLRKLKEGRIDYCILVADTGRHVIKRIFPQELALFKLSMIPSMTRPITIMVSTDELQDRIISERYRRVLEKTLNSAAYRKIVEDFYGKDNVPADRQTHLMQFVQQYQATWK